jgi:hypothetical protein
MKFGCSKKDCKNNWSTKCGTIHFCYRLKERIYEDFKPHQVNVRSYDLTKTILVFEYFIKFYNHLCKNCPQPGYINYTNEHAGHIVKMITSTFFNRLKEFDINFNEYPKYSKFKGRQPKLNPFKVNVPHRKDLCLACKNGCCEGCIACKSCKKCDAHKDEKNDSHAKSEGSNLS